VERICFVRYCSDTMTVVAVEENTKGSSKISSDLLGSQHGEENGLRRMKWQQAAFNIFFNMFGASQIPFAMSQMGWTWGPIIFILLSLCAWWSGHILTTCCIQSNCYTWGDLGTKAFGKCGGWLVAIVQTSGLVLTGALQTQGAGGLWGQSFPSAGLCTWWWIMVNAIPLIIFFQIPSFGGSWMIVFATVITLISVIWQQALYFILMGVHGGYPHTCYGGQTFSTIVSATCNMVFSFGVKSILPEMMREMKDPYEMHKSWAWSQAVALPLYALYGFIGFALYGVFNQNAGFTLQFDASPAVLSYTIFSLVGNILPGVYGQLCVFLKVELGLGVLPTDWWTVSNPSENKVPKIPPVLFRFFFRSGVVVAYVIVAEAVLDVGLGFFSGFVGAVCMTAFSFYLPWIVYWRLCHNNMSVAMKVVCAFWGFLGAAVAVAGAVTSVQQMSSMAGGIFVFQQSHCAENAFYVGQYSGGDTPAALHSEGAFSFDQGPSSFYEQYYLPTCEGKNGISIGCGQIQSAVAPNGTSCSPF